MCRTRTSTTFCSCLWLWCQNIPPQWSQPSTRGTASGEFKLPLILSRTMKVSYTKHELFSFISIRMFRIFPYLFCSWQAASSFSPMCLGNEMWMDLMKLFPWGGFGFHTYCLILLLGNNFVSLCTFFSVLTFLSSHLIAFTQVTFLLVFCTERFITNPQLCLTTCISLVSCSC